MTPTSQVKQAIAPSGKLRVGVYMGSPTSMVRDAKTGETRGITWELGQELARELGVPFEPVEFPRVAEVLQALQDGKIDFTFTNATPARQKVIDFTPPLLSLELGYLVTPGSPVAAPADVDKPGIRVGVSQGGTSHATLERDLKNAKVVPAPNLKSAIEIMTTKKADVFMTNKGVLFQMSDALPGSRIFAERWGLENMAIGIPKGRDAGKAYIQEFGTRAKGSGLVKGAADRAGLRGAVDAQ
jgi:polar amino acid transport system substrate-binding protein